MLPREQGPRRHLKTKPLDVLAETVKNDCSGTHSPPDRTRPSQEERQMTRFLALAVVALAVLSGPAFAAVFTGQYIEARTCDVWTGTCFANAEMNMAGKHAVLGWKIDKGSLDGVNLDGLGVVAIVAASDTLGLEQTGKSRAILIVDSKASAAQQKALVKL